jgi:hypothetical protein
MRVLHPDVDAERDNGCDDDEADEDHDTFPLSATCSTVIHLRTSNCSLL